MQIILLTAFLPVAWLMYLMLADMCHDIVLQCKQLKERRFYKRLREYVRDFSKAQPVHH